MANISQKYKSFIRAIISLSTLLAGYRTTAQVTPNTQAYPNPTTQTLNPIPSAYSSTIALNYIRGWEAEKPFSSDSSISSSFRTSQEVKQTTEYIDGLGRTIQTVVKGLSPSGFDMVSAQIYDSLGREQYKYLPYISSTNDGNFKNNPFADQSSFMTAFYNPTGNANGEKFFYKQTVFEASPINRVIAAYGAGNSWAGSAVGAVMQYVTSSVSDSVVKWRITYAQGLNPTSAGYYGYGQLLKNINSDENGNQRVEYKDKDGHVVLKKVLIGGVSASAITGWLCTYYIYDDLGNLKFVIQPQGVTLLKAANWTFDATTWATSTIAKQQCFSYEYDSRNRMIIKRVPGAGEAWFVYDARDRVVMRQDSSLRAKNNWAYTQYDSLDRPILTGLWTNSGNLAYHQNLAYNSVTYPSPTSNFTILTQTYYDNYAWVSTSGSSLSSTAITTYNNNTSYFSAPQNTSFPYPQSLTATNLTHGMITGTKINVINTTSYVYSVSFYDDRTRVIQTQSTNFTGGVDTAISQYGFSGRLLNTLICHGKGGSNPQAYKVLTQMTYDAAGRMTSITKKIGNSPAVVLVRNQYDELGELIQKNIGQARTSLTNLGYSATPLDSLFYTYNLRGWLRGINKDYANAVTTNKKGGNWFGMELSYDYGFSKAYLNGNISGIKWRNAEDSIKRAYGFTYDAVNRVTEADFTQNTGGVWNLSAGVDFSVHNISYDLNGNILTLNEMGLKVNTSTLIDSLLYGYNTNSNQLNYVTDRANDTTAHLGDFKEKINNSTQDYSYDGNGNLTQDNNKQISNIHYNYLNLPDSITFTARGTIKYLYGASGAKLQKIVIDNTVSPARTIRTDYAGLFVYQNDTLLYVNTEEGRIRPKRANYSDTMFYDYFEKDHLGNTRVVLTDEKTYDVYPAATLENNGNSFQLEQSFYSINTADTIGVSRIASWPTTINKNYPDSNTTVYNNDPYDTSTNLSKVVYRLNGATGDKTGLGITLKVMAGDTVRILGKSFWHSNGVNPSNTYSYYQSSIINSFIGAFAGTSAVVGSGKGATSSSLEATGSPTISTTTNWLNSTPNPALPSTPKACINWILFDDQFKVVSSSSGFDFVAGSDTVKTHNNNVSISTGGYLYVYCSNESNTDVFFDNLQVVQTRGPLLETDNYYPFGLLQAGISSQAAGKLEDKFKFNGKELQSKEFSDGTGLEWYDYGARMYDQQVGRWLVMDPMLDKIPAITPYNYCLNNPIRVVDYNGMWTVTGDGIETTDIGEIARFIDALKGEAKKDVANAITTGAEIAHTVYEDFAKVLNEHPEAIESINYALKAFKFALQKVTTDNPEKMGWGDLFAMWLFELGQGNSISFDQYAKTTQDLFNQEGVQIARSMAQKLVKMGITNQTVTYNWVYGQKEFYDGITEGNVVSSFLGSYTTTVEISVLSSGTILYKFTVKNTTSWESGTRLRKAANPGEQHQGVIPNKERGEGVGLGGNLNEVWTWGETDVSNSKQVNNISNPHQ